MEQIKKNVAEKWGYADWESLWNTFYNSKEAQEIIEEVSWELSNKQNEKLLEDRNELVEALKYFTDKVDRGEARSKDTYAVFKALLTKIENNQTPQS